jgi:hypothetical protein
MRPCDAVLDHLEAGAGAALPAELAAHVSECSDCRLALERINGLAEGAKALSGLHASPALKDRLKSLPRLAPACERALELVGTALDGEIDSAASAELMDHLHACPHCAAAWAAFATLREVGSAAHAPSGLRAALSLPPRQRIAVRRQRPFFDLRLATAAAYLLAALTVVLLSDPATVARASSEQVDKAVVYSRAVVENRFSSYSHRVVGTVTAWEGWARDRADESWEKVRHFFGAKPANQSRSSNVTSSENGGRK